MSKNPNTIYETMGTTEDVLAKGKALLPISDVNVITSLLMTFQNTLISQYEERALTGVKKGNPK